MYLWIALVPERLILVIFDQTLFLIFKFSFLRILLIRVPFSFLSTIKLSSCIKVLIYDASA